MLNEIGQSVMRPKLKLWEKILIGALMADWDIEGMWEDLYFKMIAISNACTPIKYILSTR